MATGGADQNSIAIVGMAGHFPAAPDVDSLWRLLDEGREATTWLTEVELIAAGERREVFSRENYVPATMVLPDMEKFDAAFFGFTPREAAIMDPQHRHFLECCWEALEDAGCAPDKFAGAIGVFGGCGMQAYWAHNLLSNPELVEQVGMFVLRHTGNDKDFLTTRVSYLLNLSGPSIGVQTACSTSLVAVHMACQSLLTGECDIALAGGSSIELPHGRGYLHAEGEILSSTGRCRAFDDSADGTLFGSGAGVVVLQRLQDALRDGFPIRAIIRGSAVNNDGARKAGYFAPSVDGQARAAAEALAVADVDPGSVDLIEAHGTGTLVGDPIELAALQQAYRGAPPGKIEIGSIKSNIGHLDTAAGVASLIKAALALQHERMPKTLHFERPNSRFDFERSPFRVLGESRPWPRGSQPRRAAVNSLGVGGTNAHVILEEGPPQRATLDTGAPQLIALSAKTATSLEALTRKWTTFIASPPRDFSVSDAAYTTHVGRTVFNHRRALVARDVRELAAELSSPSPGTTGVAGSAPAHIVWMFPGGGAQYPGAARDLYNAHSVFREAVEECFAASDAIPRDLRDLMFGAEGDVAAEKLREPLRSVLAVFILEYALGKLWLSWGVKPDAVLGHSAGEYAAAVFAGVMTVKDALSMVAVRGEVFRAAERGGMLVVKAALQRVREVIGDRLDVAALNGPELVVISGDEPSLVWAEDRLESQGVQTSRIHIDVAAHSRMLDAQLPRFQRQIEKLRLKPPSIKFISTLTGHEASAAQLCSAEYWTRQLRETVLFSQAMQSAAVDANVLLLEVGPGQSLSALAQACEGVVEPAAIIASTQPAVRHMDDATFILRSVGALWAHGAELDFERVRGPGPHRRIRLPTYAFDKERHWIEAGAGAVRAAAPPMAIERAPFEEWVTTRGWRSAPLPAGAMRSAPSSVVFGDDTPLCDAVVAALNAAGGSAIVVRRGRKFARRSKGEFVIDPHAPEDYAVLLEAIEAEGKPEALIHLWSWDAPSLQWSNGRPALPLGFDSLFELTKAVELSGEPVRICAVTCGAAALNGKRAAHPERAALLGPCRVVVRETPGVEAQLIDFDPHEEPRRVAAAIVGELTARSADTFVAYRGGTRLIERAGQAPARGKDRVRDGGVWLITGGLGDLGLAFARYLVSRSGAKLALLSSQPVAPRENWPRLGLSGDPDQARRIRALMDLERVGAEFVVVQADVANGLQLEQAVQAVRERFGEINGVVHAAGRVDDQPIAMKTAEAAWRVMAPKIAGGVLLDDLFPPGSLDAFIVFSSVSVSTAPAGQCDYVAANAVLDSIASGREDGLSIAWGPWTGIGMAARMLTESNAKGPLAHPLLGRRAAEGDDAVVRFYSTLSPASSWVLSEHVFGGCYVLPGAALIEMANAAAQQLGCVGAFSISNVNFPIPLAIAQSDERTVRTSLTPIGAGHWRMEVESRRAAAEDWVLHFECRLMSDAPEAPRSIGAVANPKELDQSRLALADRNIEFGPRWRSVVRGAVGDAHAEISLELPEQHHADLSCYRAHPALLDLAAAAGLFLLEDMGKDGAVYAPISFARFDQFRPIPSRLTAIAELRERAPRVQSSFDVELKDDHGRLIAFIEGATFRRVDPSGISQAANPPLSLRADATTLERLVALGIRASEADRVFDRVLDHNERSVFASAVSPLRMLDIQTAPAAPKTTESVDEQVAAGDYANDVEARLARMCADILGVAQVRPDDEFLSFGGGSLAGVRLFARIRKEMGVDLALSTLFQAPTLRALAELVQGKIDPGAAISSSKGTPSSVWSPLVRIRAGSPGWPPFFCVHGGGGNVVEFKPLDRLPKEVPFYGLQAQGVDGRLPFLNSIEEMAQSYVDAIRTVDDKGPYRLAGYSGGGVIAFEMAQILTRAGAKVELLAMFDTLAPEEVRTPITIHDKLRLFRTLTPPTIWRLARSWVERRFGIEEEPELTPLEVAGSKAMQAYMEAQMRYDPQPYPGNLLLFRARHTGWEYARAGETLGWQRHVTGDICVIPVDANHHTVFKSPAIDVIIRELSARLAPTIARVRQAHRQAAVLSPQSTREDAAAP